MPRLSIILPVLGNPAQMEDSLVSVLENRPDDCEILVVLNESYDDPYDLKDEVCFIEAPHGSRLVDSINLGIAVSRAPIIHLLTCGVEVSEGWSDKALADFADPAIASVMPLVFDRRDRQRVVSAGTRYDGYGMVRELAAEAGTAAPREALVDPEIPVAFYRKSALDLVGRLSGKVGDRLACVDLALALRHAGFRSVVEPRCPIHAETALRPREAGFVRGWAAERLFWRWLPDSPWLRAMPLHLLLVLLECVWTLPRPAAITQLVGRLWGSLQIAAHRSHWQSLEETRRHATVPALPPEAPHFHHLPSKGRDRRNQPIGQSQLSG